jgi:DNA-binding CsgD family transcriptional regulator
MVSQAANLHALAGDLRRGIGYCAQAGLMAERADTATQLGCRAMNTHLRLIHGDALDLDNELAELVWLGTLVGPDAPEELVSLGRLIVFDLMALGRWDQADDLATRVIAQARSAGLRGVESFVHGLRGEVAWRRGRWIEARAEALFEVHFNETNLGATGSFAHATLARVEAATGRFEASVRHAGVVIDLGARLGMGVLESWGRHARGLARLSGGDAEAAALDLAWIWELCQQGEIGESGPLWWHGDLFESLWRAGHDADAGRLADYLAQRAAATGGEWVAAIERRARGVLDSDPHALLDSAMRLDEIGAPFEAARSRALLGEIAPSAFVAEVSLAHQTFSSLGARPWVERTELVVGPTSTPTPAPLDLLTKAESRVAAAVSRGLTNRDAADSLFISPRTVDAHLQHIYRKLGVGSRTELALLLNGATAPSRTR